MNPQRRIRRNTKPLDALKAAAIILLLLFVSILILWIATRLMRPEEPKPDLTPRPAKSMWEDSAPSR
jgi:ABC-type Fe3+ transport system permease subunit